MFRQTYDFDLDEERFSIVATGTLKLKKGFKIYIENFIQWFKEIPKHQINDAETSTSNEERAF